MNRGWIVAGVLALSAQLVSAQIKGTGSSSVASLYAGWSQATAKAINLRIEYDPSGSSAGINAAQEQSADFGATGRPLPRSILDQAGLAQFPTAIGATVLVTNVPGISSERIKLDGETIAGIFLGSVKKWDDPSIKALNPNLALPSLDIVPVFRSQGSGTSFAFTSYLSKVSPQFKSIIGPTSTLNLPHGQSGKTAADMEAIIRGTPGAIGYLDYSFAFDRSLATVALKNRWGNFVSANAESLQLAMRAADWEKLMIDQDPTFELDFTDTGCPGCWPMTSASYVLVPLKGRASNSMRVLDFFQHSLRQGDEIAIRQGYVPLPTRAKGLVGVAMNRWYGTLEKAGSGKARQR